MLRLLADEHIGGAIIRGTLRRVPSGEFFALREVGLAGRPDPVILEFAGQNAFVVVTKDISTMPNWALRRVANLQPMPGLLVVSHRLSIATIIDELELFLRAGQPQDLVDRVTHLPL